MLALKAIPTLSPLIMTAESLDVYVKRTLVILFGCGFLRENPEDANVGTGLNLLNISHFNFIQISTVVSRVGEIPLSQIHIYLKQFKNSVSVVKCEDPVDLLVSLSFLL